MTMKMSQNHSGLIKPLLVLLAFFLFPVTYIVGIIKWLNRRGEQKEHDDVHNVFVELTKHVEFSNDLKHNIHLFLTANKCPKTADHCIDVGREARRLAVRFQADPRARCSI